jgi:hypothetical protein
MLAVGALVPGQQLPQSYNLRSRMPADIARVSMSGRHRQPKS